MRKEARPFQEPLLLGHLAGPKHRHANTLAVEPESLRVVEATGRCSPVEAVHESLHAMAQGVGILEEQRAVLLEGIRVCQEHGFSSDDLCVDHGQELDDLRTILRAELIVEKTAELRQALLSVLGHGGHLPEGGPLHAHSTELLAQGHSLRLDLSGALQELDELFKAPNRLDDLREITRELHAAKDVVPILLAGLGVCDAQHAHGLAGLAYRGVHAAFGQGEEGLADAEDQLRQVESAQDVLGQDLSIDDQAEGFLSGGGGIVVVHQCGRNLNKNRPGHGSNHASGIAVDAPSHSDYHDLLATLLGCADRFQQLHMAVSFWALARLP